MPPSTAANRSGSRSAEQARLLDSLLTLAEGERGLGRTEPIDLAASAGAVLADRAAAVRERGLRLRTDITPAPPVGLCSVLGWPVS